MGESLVANWGEAAATTPKMVGMQTCHVKLDPPVVVGQANQ